MADAAAGAGTFELGAWDETGGARLDARGDDAEQALLAGLTGVIAAARGGGAPVAAPEGEASSAAAIRGQGADLGAVFADLVADLLAQLDANGTGLDRVRLDGLLATDDGGFTAWGYALGEVVASPPPVGLALDGDPTMAQGPGGVVLRCALRRR